VSQSTSDAMKARLGWRGPVRIVPNGLSPAPANLTAVRPAPAGRAGEQAASGDGPVPVLTWVGRMVAHKRVERVLDVAERLGPAGARIDVIGRGPCSAALADAVATRGLADVVRLHGYLAEDAKRTTVGASVLHLNTSQGEGWGLCVLEAAQLGVPTVAYDVDGLRDAVRDGETGWLVRADQRIEDVVEGALAELANPSRRAEIATACRVWAAQFDWERSAGQLAELIAAAAGRSSEPEPAGQVGVQLPGRVELAAQLPEVRQARIHLS
jgi:glycosyltransferase involved in cell wall biosynthesis